MLHTEISTRYDGIITDYQVPGTRSTRVWLLKPKKRKRRVFNVAAKFTAIVSAIGWRARLAGEKRASCAAEIWRDASQTPI